MMTAIVSILLVSNLSLAANPTQRALTEAGIVKTDSLQTKINLLLFLLNDRRYLSESSPDPQYAQSARFQTTPLEKATQIIEGLRENDGNPFNPYALGTRRTPEEMLAQRIGGQCEAAARTLAHLLVASGTPASEVRIVEGVTKQDYAALCPTQGMKTESHHLGLTGHAFVLIKIGSEWKLINPTFAPIGNFDSHHGPHRGALEGFRRPPVGDGKSWNESMIALIKKLTPQDLDMITFKSPKDLEKDLKGNRLPSLPEFPGLPEYKPGPPGQAPIRFRDLGAFLVTTPSDFPNHQYSDRSNLIASGNLKSNICRFKPDDLESHQTQTAPPPPAAQ